MTTRAALAHDLEVAGLEQRAAAMRADLAAGLVPEGVTRALFAHELVAKTNFAELEDEITAAAKNLALRARSDRARVLALIDADLRATALQPGPASQLHRIALRVFDLDARGVTLITGADQVIADAERYHRGRLEVAAGTAARRVIGEARAQGLPLTSDDLGVKLDEIQANQLDLLARRLAQAPHIDLLRALRDQVIAEEKDFLTADELVDRLVAHAHTLSDSPLDDMARTGVQQADAMGRVAAAQALPTPKAIYASELLDRRTCPACSLVDGREYDTITEARRDYPHGTYRLCEGGLRCRGTLVFVWPTEADPTLQTPGDKPAKPVGNQRFPLDATVHPAERIRVQGLNDTNRQVAATAKEAARVLSIMGGLHDVPARAGTIPLEPKPNLAQERGILGGHARNNGRSTRIVVDTSQPDVGLTVAHESGHYLDWEALGEIGSAASTSPLMARVMEAIDGSDAVARLRRTAATTDDPDFAESIELYWLRSSELWARAYSQWVAERSGDRALIASVRRIAGQTPYQWGDDDFEAIGLAIDQLLGAALGFRP